MTLILLFAAFEAPWWIWLRKNFTVAMLSTHAFLKLFLLMLEINTE